QIGYAALQWVIRTLRIMMGGQAERPVLGPRAREAGGIAARLAVLFPFMVFVLFPFYWIVVTSMKTTEQISARTNIFWPQPPTFAQYEELIQRSGFVTWLMNSVIVATASTVLSVGLAALAAYALTRLRFLGAGLLTTLLLITYLLPGTLLFIPLYQTLNAIGLINSYGALIVTYP